MIAGIETSALSNKVTGTSRYIHTLLEQLKNFDDEVKTFSAFDNNNFINSLFLNKRGIKKILYRNFLLTTEMEKASVDYAIFPDYFMPPDFTKPSAVVIHDLSFITHPEFYSKSFVKFYNYNLKKTLQKNPFIVTISEHSKNEIVKNLGIKEKEIFLLQSYYKPALINNEENTIKHRKYFLYVGHIEPRKNLQFLISNFLDWKKNLSSDYKLVIAGELWIKTAEIKNLYKKYQNHPDIEFAGYIDEKTLIQLYKNASGFVHTSFEEGFSLPVLEAMSYQLPIICSENHAAYEISRPCSIPINPCNNNSLHNAFNLLYDLRGEKINYEIKYSPSLMKQQLSKIIDKLKEKTKNKLSFYIPVSVSKEEAIEKTLIYYSIFSREIQKKKLYDSIFDIKVNEKEFNFYLLKAELKNIIFRQGEKIFLNTGLKPFYKRKSKNISEKKNIAAIKLITHIPFISAAAFSGGTAHYGIQNHDDVDLFIITKPDTLYIVYFLIHILSKMFGLRKNLCANYLVDENNLEIKNQKDFYTAHQIISLKILKNKEMLEIFIKKNEWVKNYFPNFKIDYVPEGKKSGKKYKIFLPVNFIIKKFYKILYKNELKKYSHSNSFKLENGILKLHINDNRKTIINEFRRRLNHHKNKQNLRKNIAV